MNSLLSIFVCLAMLLSGAYTAEDPAAPMSTVATISDVVVTLNGEEYALPQMLSLGVSTQNNTALFDVSMTSGDYTLFPAQLKLDDAGLAVLLDLPEEYGQPTAYVFSNEYLAQVMGEMEMPEAFPEFMTAYCRLLAKASQLSKEGPNSELSAQMSAYMLELAGDSFLTEETTLNLDGAEVPATRIVCSLDAAQLGQLADYEVSLLDPEFGPLYFEFLNATLAMSGEEDLPEMGSFADLFGFYGLDMRMDFDLTTAENGAGEGTITVVMAVDGETIELPLEMTMQDADTGEVRMYFTQDDASMALNCLLDGAQMDMDFIINADGASVAATLYASQDESGSVGSASFSVFADGTSMNFDAVKTIDGDCGSIELYCAVSVEEQSYGLSMRIDTAPEAIEDRVADAQQVVISSVEDTTPFADMNLSLLHWSGYTEALMEDESVSALVEAISSLKAEDNGFELYPDDDDTYVSDEPDDLSYAIPEFTWLPEGYELTETDIWASLDNAALSFDYTGDDDAYHSSLYVDLYSAEETINYTFDADGSFSALEQPVINFSDADDMITASCIVNGLDVRISYYDNDLTIDDIVSLINGMVFAD